MTALDEVYERLNRAEFENAAGFVDHTPMACEALTALGLEDHVPVWARNAGTARGGTAIRAAHRVDADWRESLGDYTLLHDWIGHFDRAIDDAGWTETVATWVPRLLPAMGTSLFHAMIRTAHATRALSVLDTPPRRHELARALGYWAARYGYGRRVTLPVVVIPTAAADDSPLEVAQGQIAAAAADGARHYVRRPNASTLHSVTGAMAVHLLSDHIPLDASRAAVIQLRRTQQALLGATATAVTTDVSPPDWAMLARVAADSHDEHTVKLVEAARRGLVATGDDIFVAAAQASMPPSTDSVAPWTNAASSLAR